MRTCIKAIGRVLLFALVIGAIIATALICDKSIEKGLESQVIDNLKDVAEQSTVVLSKEITAKQRLLDGMAQEIAELGGDNKEQILKHLEPYVDVYGIKRIGFIYPDGTAYTTDGYVQDLSSREYFKNGLNGYADITTGIIDKMGDQAEVNVFSEPVYAKDGTVAGVVFATYSVEQFKEIISVDSFSGSGSCIVIKEDGTVISGVGNLNIGNISNIYQALDGSEESKSIEEKVRKDVVNQRSGYTKVKLNGVEHYAYYMPVEANIYSGHWYMFDVVSADILENRTDMVSNYVKLLVAVIVVSMVIAGIALLLSNYKQQRELRKLAYLDTLTNGDNYAYFEEKLRRRRNKNGYIVSLDIDEFRIINNMCGVLMGDALIQNINKILLRNIRQNELCARVNADRFILFLVENDKDILVGRIEKIRAEILDSEKDLNIPKVYPYFGIYKMRQFDEVESGYGYANQAKHLVKGNHNEFYCFYEDIDYKQRVENKKLEDGFDEAIKNRRFEVWYQPKFDTQTGIVVSSEALVRWRDANDGLIPPGRFIPLFEKNGMIRVLDEYVIDEVCRCLKNWEEEGMSLLPVSVNVSRVSLYYPDVVEKYRSIVDSYGIDPKYVQIEITESAAIEDEMVNQLLDKFRKYGFYLLLDDFGNGYSSLATLNEMKFDTLKLDKSLIDYIGDKNGELLLFYIIKLAHDLGLHVTAEGVETKNQVEFLKTLECDDIQGYYFSKPLPKIDYEVMLA